MRAACLIIILILFITDAVKGGNFDLRLGATTDNESQYIEFIKKDAPSENAFIAVQRLAERHIRAKDWVKAAGIFREYQELFPHMMDRFDKIINLLEAPEEGLSVNKLGEGVNTSSGEYHPTPTGDGKLIYYTRISRGANGLNEDIFVSKKLNDHSSGAIWGNAIKLEGDYLNTNNNEAIMSISEDGQKLIVFGNYKGSYERGDIFWADKNYMGEWGKPNHFPWPINTNYFESDGQLVAGDQVLIFASDRPGGVGEEHQKGELYHGDITGNVDIYVCIKDETGLWGDPINLGEIINTPYTERFPFLHPDGKTLYFCSDGHYGLGRSDVFMSRRLREDSWTEWSEPVNLGKEVNTPDKEFNFKVSTMGDKAYFAKGEQPIVFDIYTQEVPKSLRPTAVAQINGIVLDFGDNPLGAHIVLKEVETGAIREADSDAETGTFFFPLKLGRKYVYAVSKRNYKNKRGTIDLRDRDTTVNFSRTDTIRMRTELIDNPEIGDIRFASGSDKVDPKSFPELDRLSQVLKEHTYLNLEISAHTDSVGSDSYNQGLSERRASSVVRYLISKGVPSNMIQAKGYGESRPIAPNSTEEGRALNRRVESTVLGGRDPDEDEEAEEEEEIWDNDFEGLDKYLQGG